MLARIDHKVYDRTAWTLTAALQHAAPDAVWKTATLEELTQAGDPSSRAVEYYVVEARVPAREFLLRKGMPRRVVEQDMNEAVEALVQLLTTRLTHTS